MIWHVYFSLLVRFLAVLLGFRRCLYRGSFVTEGQQPVQGFFARGRADGVVDAAVFGQHGDGVEVVAESNGVAFHRFGRFTPSRLREQVATGEDSLIKHAVAGALWGETILAPRNWPAPTLWP